MAILLGVALTAGACSDSGAEPTTTEREGRPAATADEGGSTQDDDPGDGPSEADFGEVAAEVDRFVADNGLSGAGLVVVDRDAGTVFEHYAGDFGPDRISLIASASKVLTAGVLMRLDDEGVLDVDAPIGDVVDWAGDHADVTPAQLLSNSSGLVGLEVGMGVPDYLCQYLPAGTLQDCARRILNTTGDDALVVEPDTEFRYGGAQWQVAGAVAEAASGRTWAELVEETYVEPCGLGTLAYNNHFTQIVDPSGPFSYPTAFAGDPDTLAPTRNPTLEGGAYTTPRDYAALLLMHLRDGRCDDERVLSADAAERMRVDRIGPTYDGGTFINELGGYGLGWWVDRQDPGHVQDAGAFGTVPWLDTELGYGAYLVVERRSVDGMRLARTLRPLIEAQFSAGG
jgi:CubicO group peptidase (beta-lactamase class C family)